MPKFQPFVSKKTTAPGMDGVLLEKKRGTDAGPSSCSRGNRDVITRTVGHSRDLECHPVRSGIPRKECEQRSN